MLNRKPITFSPYPGQEQTTNKSTYLCISRAWPRRAWLSGTSQDAFGQEINQTSNLLLSESNRSGKKIVCPVPILFPQFLLVFLTIRKIPPRIFVPEILSKYLIMRKKNWYPTFAFSFEIQAELPALDRAIYTHLEFTTLWRLLLLVQRRNVTIYINR